MLVNEHALCIFQSESLLFLRFHLYDHKFTIHTQKKIIYVQSTKRFVFFNTINMLFYTWACSRFASTSSADMQHSCIYIIIC